MTELFPQSEVNINVQVLQSDGGIYNVSSYCMHTVIHIVIAGDYSVCVNAATMALIDAGIPMKDFVCACSASYVEDTSILGEHCMSLGCWEDTRLGGYSDLGGGGGLL